MTKAERHEVIMALITEEAIGNQAELLTRLAELGFETTQATISRDLRELQILRQKDDDGVFRYRRVQTENGQRVTSQQRALDGALREYAIQVVSVEFMIIVKTISASANVLSTYIEDAQIPDVIATLAGFDTIYVTCRDAQGAEKLAASWQPFVIG
jgi:transcriptional regulator of arginine metabolism